MTSCSISVDAKVTEIKDNQAVVKISSPEYKSCQQCHDKGGCKSVSLSQYFIKNRELLIVNDNYSKNQNLKIELPNNFLSKTLFILIGLPLVFFLLPIFTLPFFSEPTRFLIGLVNICITLFVAKYIIRNKLNKSLKISLQKTVSKFQQ